ncbi:site-specific integrase [Rhodoferax ferrireducens]|uniref:site-specific integrase n=1 Tax=Rhodoferax ferrireducens TaxID=192843 RepID=UPI0013009640|nr:site-specific integrase [Rhodoferax ferrireducens]
MRELQTSPATPSAPYPPPCSPLYAVPQSAPSLASSPRQPYAKLPQYLHRRGRLFYFKRKIPADLRHVFGDGREQMWKALGTSLLEKAKVMLAVEVSEFDFAVAKQRRLLAARAAGVPERATEARTSLPCGTAPGAPSPEQQAHLDLVHSLEDGLLKLRAMVPASPSTSSGASHGEVRVPTGVKTRTPPSNSVVKPKAKPATQVCTDPTYGARKPTLLHLYEDWKRKQTRHRTTNAVLKTVHEFREIHGSLAVESITRQHARDYRDLLIEKGLAKGSIENRIGFLSTLVRHGMVEIIEDLARNPFEKIGITGGAGIRVKKNRRAYKVAELNTLYSSALYTGDYEVKGQVLEAAYWLPILGPFMGARIEELSQLRVEDIQRVNGVWCARICDLDDDQKLKNDGSFRRVPLHEAVIKCGFLVHAAKMAKAGHERIFPSLSNDNANGVFSNAVGKWYGRYLEFIGLTDHRLDYHSFRYSFRQQCSLCDVEAEPRDALTGHWVGKSDGGRTYLKGENAQYPFPKLVDAIQKLRYDELRILHLFVDEPMAGVEAALLR